MTRAQQPAHARWPVLSTAGVRVPGVAQDVPDQANTAVVRRVVTEHGWPGHDLVGEAGAQAAARLALRVTDPDFQRHLLGLLAEAVRAGDALPRQWAHLHDRCRALAGALQWYGTQYRLWPSGGLELCPVADPSRLDTRRAEVGLPPHADSEAALHRRVPADLPLGPGPWGAGSLTALAPAGMKPPVAVEGGSVRPMRTSLPSTCPSSSSLWSHPHARV
ncbi:DUF6624 domain-containing protein [Streptomyces mobaraensis]|uniref:DUF6624 domain-containing protein n=1 Tax=Streptomyces mobaraensis TaxID=35621 RepID=UPI003B96799C